MISRGGRPVHPGVVLLVDWLGSYREVQLRYQSPKGLQVTVHIAHDPDRVTVVQRLLDGGANPNVGEDRASMPLTLAIEAKRLDLVRMLCEAGATVDFTPEEFEANKQQPSSDDDADADNNKDLLDESNQLQNFSVADFVDYIQTLANFRAVNGGTMSRLGYAEDMLEENEINLEAATGRIMDADMAAESTKLARQNVLVQAGAAMVTQANALSNVVLSLLQ